MIAAAAVAAVLPSVEATETLTIDYRRAPGEGRDFDAVDWNDDLLAVMNRLSLRVAQGRASAGVRLDQSGFVDVEGENAGGAPDCPREDPRCPRADFRPGRTVLPERLWVEIDAGAVRGRAGDIYVSFGRGMALSLRKIDAIGLDTALRGGRLDLRHGPLALVGVAGAANVQNVDPATLRHVDDPADVIAGARLEGRVATATLGGHAVVLDEIPGSGEHVQNRVGGATADLALAGGKLLLGVETDWLDAERTLATGDVEPRAGRAGYGRAQILARPVTMLVEFKDYDAFRLNPTPTGFLTPVYAAAPTLERDGEEDPSGVHDLGGRARVDWLLASRRLNLFANYLLYGTSADVDESRIDSGDRVSHAYAGVEKRFDRADLWVIAVAGFRRTTESFERQQRVVHGELDVGLPLPRPVPGSVGLRWVQREERKRAVPDDKDVRRILATLAWHLPPRWEFALLYGHDDEFSETQPVHYVGGEALVRPIERLTFKVFGGARPGGLICASGTCRYLPPFSGVQGELVARF